MIKNDAINLCLRYIGEAPLPDGVAVEDLDSQHEASIINNILDELSKSVQAEGWWFNREAWTFQPDSTTNKIAIPSTVLYFETEAGDYLVRGNTLYDKDNKTYSFTASVDATVYWEVDFESLPLVAARYINYLAAQEAQVFFNGDSAIDKDLQTKITKAFIELRRAELRQSNYNLISGSRLVSRTTNPTGVS